MQDKTFDNRVHWDNAGFDEFVEQELIGLAERARARNICFDCLGDRIIFEIVVGMARGGVPENDILSIFEDALAEVEHEPVAEVATKGRLH